MYHNLVRRRIPLAAAAAGAALILSACGSDTGTSAGPAGDMANMPGMSQSPQGSATWNETDVAFAQMMIPDHEMVAEMGKLAEKKASSQELKTVAKELQEDQAQTIDTLKGWLQDWGKPASGNMAGMDMPGAMTAEDMDELSSMSGMEFDMMFAQMMIKHHEGYLEMARDEQAKGVSTEAKAMAADMLTKQQAQIEKLRGIAEM